MASDHDVNGHLTLIEVAEHAEGLLPAGRADFAAAHLESCPVCQGMAAAVTGVSATLADAPRELTMPGDVLARVDAAIAREADARRQAPALDPAPGFISRAFGPLRGRLPAIAAGAASVAVLGLIGYTVANDGVGSDDTADAGDAATAEMADEEAASAPMDQAEPDAAEEPEEESADRDAGDDVGTLDGEADDSDGESSVFGADVPAPERAALAAELQDIVASRAQSTDDGVACGSALAYSLEQTLIGSAGTELVEPDSILVALDTGDPSTVAGWVLPDCDATVDDSLLNFTAPRKSG